MFKKLLFTAVTSVGIHAAVQAQTAPTFNSFHVYSDSCGVSNILPTFINGYVSNANTNTSLEVFWGDGTSTIANSSGQGYFHQNHIYAATGVYTVAGVLKQNGVAIDTILETYNSFCDVILGRPYKRTDANCSRDLNTEHIINAPYTLEIRKAGVPVDTIQGAGHFFKKINGADMTSVFTIHVIDPPFGTTVSSCYSNGFAFKFDTLDYNNQIGFEIPFDCSSSTSFDAGVSGTGFFRPVATSHINILPYLSTCMNQAATVTLELSPKYNYVASSATPISVNGNVITWDVAAVSGNYNAGFYVSLSPVGTLTLGDTVMNKLTVSPITGDAVPANNVFQMIDSIRSSFDPNDKHVNPAGDILPGQTLTYTINFENLGNDTAFNIHIMDTLSSSLDWSTLRVLNSSHPVAQQLLPWGNEKVLRFDFADIKLADASNPSDNKGFVVYQIAARSGLNPGTVVNNTAHIYFDINPAVVTNTTRSKVPNEVSIKKVLAEKSINVYPNPANDQLYVEELQKFTQLSIINALGAALKVIDVDSKMQSISLSEVPAGIYFLKGLAKDGVYVQQFIKK